MRLLGGVHRDFMEGGCSSSGVHISLQLFLLTDRAATPYKRRNCVCVRLKAASVMAIRHFLIMSSYYGRAAMEKAQEFFDKKFVVAAVLIGLGYTVVILLINWLVGKESAGVASIALTAIATAIFKNV
jgi:hypothetical protein